jgi:hypothetical protein
MSKEANSIRNKINETAQKALIFASEEFCLAVEAELEKYITPEFLEKMRGKMVKAKKSEQPAAPQTKPTRPPVAG